MRSRPQSAFLQNLSEEWDLFASMLFCQLLELHAVRILAILIRARATKSDVENEEDGASGKDPVFRNTEEGMNNRLKRSCKACRWLEFVVQR